MRVHSILIALTVAACAAAAAPETAPPAGPVLNEDGSATFKVPTVGVTTTTVDVATTGTVTGSNKQAFAGEEYKQWAGELEPRIAGDKAAFAGIDDHFRVALNSVRISDGAEPVVADVPLKLAAFRLAKDVLAADDKPDGAAAKIVAMEPLKYAKAEGYTGAGPITALVHTEEPAVARAATDREGAVLSAVKTWTASKDALAGIDDSTHKAVGSMGYLSASGRAFYVTLLGK